MRVLAVLLCVSSLLLGCGDSSDPPAPATTQAAGPTSDISRYAAMQEYSRGIEDACQNASGALADLQFDAERIQRLAKAGDREGAFAAAKDSLDLYYRRLRRTVHQMTAVKAPPQFAAFRRKVQARQRETDATIDRIRETLRTATPATLADLDAETERNPGGFRKLRLPRELRDRAGSCATLFAGS